jgi:hypothetical protein
MGVHKPNFFHNCKEKISYPGACAPSLSPPTMGGAGHADNFVMLTAQVEAWGFFMAWVFS